MPFLDKISDLAGKLAPSKSSKFMAGGIGSGHGMVPIDDDMIVSKPTIVAYSSQIFFNLIAMICFAAVASFQAKWGVGPSGLTGFALFISIASMLLSAFMLSIQVVCEKHDKFVGLARALKEVRISFILTGTGLTFSLLIAFIVTISAWTEPGCKNAKSDPNAETKGDDFVNGLPGWCTTKKSGAIFFWLAFVCWCASMAMLIMDWRSGKLIAARDPPFIRPQVVHEEEGVEGVEEEEEEEEDASHSHLPPVRQSIASSPPNAYANSNLSQSPFADSNRYSGHSQIPASTPSVYTPAPQAAGRQSMDAYGAFSDPAPSGFGTYQYNQVANSYATPRNVEGPPILPEPDLGPMVSRTMQYADPYAAVRRTIAGQQQGSPTSVLPPPSYVEYR
jgi:hypothetical protein